MTLKNLSAAVLGSAVLSAGASASIVINITARQLSEDIGATTPLVAGTLIQLVNLGADGLFNQINIADGSTTGLSQWVTGDDSLIGAAYLISGNPGDFPSAAAFDLANGTDATAGRMSRTFEFASGAILAGTKLGIRWFPGLQAANFNGITLAAGQKYGEFSRQASPLYGLDLWVAPADGATVTFDNLKTVNQAGGADPMSAGAPLQTVIPEPASIAMSLMGAAGLAMLRRRRA
jgi:hypothetical protein